MTEPRLHVLSLSAPLPPAEGGDDGFITERRRWEEKVVAIWNATFADQPPFSLDEFDGCTFGLDICRHCCLTHDLAYHFDLSRKDADVRMRDCIAAIGEEEDRFGWWWYGASRVYWAAVRVFGGPRLKLFFIQRKRGSP